MYDELNGHELEAYLLWSNLIWLNIVWGAVIDYLAFNQTGLTTYQFARGHPRPILKHTTLSSTCEEISSYIFFKKGKGIMK